MTHPTIVKRASTLIPVGMSLVALASHEGAVATPSAAPAREPAVLRCPAVMEVRVIGEKYVGWQAYSNDPLRLTGADISYVVDNEDALLDPDTTEPLNDDHLSSVSVFRLASRRAGRALSLVCHYGVHAQLSRAIPARLRECRVVRHGSFDDGKESEFEASCE